LNIHESGMAGWHGWLGCGRGAGSGMKHNINAKRLREQGWDGIKAID
jgi:hypothetical protein